MKAKRMTDGELLNRYMRGQDRMAMDELIRRYVDLVYGVARRQMADPHQAEDVTQAVFLTLSAKAASVPADRLAGWLFLTTRYAAANARKIAARRAWHERQAARQRPESVMLEHSEIDPRLVAALDDAIASLKSQEREVVIQRYLQGRDIASICAVMGISDAALRKRTERAILKLRGFFASRGITGADSQAIVSALSLVGAAKAPPSVFGIASSGACGTASHGAISIGKGIAWMTHLAKAKGAAVLLAGLALSVAATAQVQRYYARVAESPPCAVPIAVPSDPSDAKRALERIARAFRSPVQRYFTSFHGESYVERYDSPDQRPTEKFDARLFRDGQNIDVLSERHGHWPGHKPVDSQGTRRVVAAKSFVEFDTVANETPKRGLFNPDGAKLRFVATGYLYGAEALEGYFGGNDLPFWEVLARYDDLHVAIEPDLTGATR
ncbi:MAG TPA: sigma-70 family RNA polymerase sigma factor, partial [Tepidisphaeraceae bacterium]|nr:sigma-70 family RNA polymerase sigma factor [Tepidisphaeraceae bacterium]